MYGMVNRAIKDYLIVHHGEETWHKVLKNSKTSEDNFLSMEYYSDEITISLIVAAAPETSKTVDQLLEEIGIFWIEFALKSDYGPLLRSAGSSLREVLESLDSLHSRLISAFPELTPPSFLCTNAEPTQSDDRPAYSEALMLHYLSEREGLSAFVVGLVQGLAKMLKVDCRVRLIEKKAEGADHDTFLVEYAEKAVGNGFESPQGARRVAARDGRHQKATY